MNPSTGTRSILSLAALAALGVGCSANNSGDGGDSPDPYDIDSDSDGLSDGAEADLGTDPSEADTDGDGYDDGGEIDEETSPFNAYSHIYEQGNYNVGNLDELPEPTGPTGTGYYEQYSWDAYQVGDIPENFNFGDQYGQRVDLYSFFGNWIMIAVGAEWCPPCRDMAAVAQEHQDEYGPQGFQLIEVLTQDSAGNQSDQATAERWASDFGLTSIPVLVGIEEEMMPWDKNASIPSVYWINPEGSLVSADDFAADPAEFLD